MQDTKIDMFGINSRASPAPVPLVDALQRMAARWRTEAL
jgi:hypothetical protein